MRNPSILTLVQFEKDRLPANGFGSFELRNESVFIGHIENLIQEIKTVKNYYKDKNLLDKVLVTVYYNNITPKTSRISCLFCNKETSSFDTTVGAHYEKFLGDNNKTEYRHVVTHFIDPKELDVAIDSLERAKEIIADYYEGEFKKEYSKKDNYKTSEVFKNTVPLRKTRFLNIMKDVSEVYKIDVLLKKIDKTEKIVSFFSCFSSPAELEKILKKIGMEGKIDVLDENAAILTDDQLEILEKEAPYLVCMCEDFSSYVDNNLESSEDGIESLVPTVDEKTPTIGVFDTYFDQKSFFSNYVEVVDLLKDKYTPNDKDYYHGSKITSILVMGHLLNGKEMDDKCGFFKVKHYVVGGYHYLDFETLYSKIEDVIKENCSTIKVWNLSIGDKKGSNPNYISLLASKIDEISRKYNVLFVVSGSNIDSDFNDIRIGSPADSLNALVVNSIDNKGQKPNYARRGPILTFVQKPDINYFGGTEDKPLICYSPNPNGCHGYGTSLSAPYIARKCAYLIHVCKMPVQCAKALLIDEAYGWGEKFGDKEFLGYGTPETNIDEIIGSNRDEIKLIFYGSTQNQHTYISDFPLLLDSENRFNYRTKLTFCYFTYGQRKLGVDYASQDISVSFGPTRIKAYKNRKVGIVENHIKVESILSKDHSVTSIDYTGEPINVQEYGKWNNTKIFTEKTRKKGKIYDKNTRFGIMLKHLERLGTVSNEEWERSNKHSVNFGIIITFKTIDGTDAKYEDFYDLLKNKQNYILRPLTLASNNIISVQEEGKIKFED